MCNPRRAAKRKQRLESEGIRIGKTEKKRQILENNWIAISIKRMLVFNRAIKAINRKAYDICIDEIIKEKQYK